MEYDFRKIEAYWQAYWQEHKTFKAENQSSKPKYYVLDMFPYPSGAGLHVGHPLGYIASDIYARYKRLQGFNVLHPMGFDAYGLPAEQYAIQTGQHPAETTQKNIARYRQQLDLLGFSFDWDREVRTCDPAYYHWTQWVFIRLFHSWYDKKARKARPDTELESILAQEGNARLLEEAACSPHEVFSAQDWVSYSEKERQKVLMNYRLAFLSDTMVNWCPKLGTVLANDEVINGLSQRGGYPVERKLMKQWSLRITAYAQRLLDGLDELDWTDSLKEMQRNWIGKSTGAEVRFEIENGTEKGLDKGLEIFTTRPDTLFGVSFMVLCPEHEMIPALTTAEQKEAVEAYVKYAKNRTERERQADVNREASDMDFGIRIGRIRDGGHHGRSRARQPGLPFRQALQPAHTPGRGRRGHQPGSLRSQGRHLGQLGFPERAQSEGGDQPHGGGNREERNRQSPDELPLARCHLQPPALLGRTLPYLL